MLTIHQPEFLPYLGFFDRLLEADIFVVLDDVGYEKNGFINRNRIKLESGPVWLTVPVLGRSPNKKINEVLIDNSKDWGGSILDKIKKGYRDSPYFDDYYGFLEETLSKKWEKIADLDAHLIKNIGGFLGKKIEIEKSSSAEIGGKKTERLINICKHYKADTYLSGPAGKDYMDMELFKKADIKVIFQDFMHPEYPQQFSEAFIKNMSVIDLLFNCGKSSSDIIKGKKE